jgi:pimeloyl-ACP methyl ester carboxylesterase
LIPIGEFSMNVDVHEGRVPVDTVFVHGNLASNTWWKPALDIWTEQSAGTRHSGRLIFGEWRGCGKSSRAKDVSEFEIANMANDYVQALRKLDVKKACLVGHSTGGLICLSMMLQAPELFDRAVLLDSIGSSGLVFPEDKLAAYRQISVNKGLCAFALRATIYGDVDDELFKSIVDDAFGVGNLNWLGVPDAIGTFNVTDQLERITQPVLVLHGEFDATLAIEESRILASNLPNAEFRELKGRGHSCNVEDPKLFVQTVNEFLFA